MPRAAFLLTLPVLCAAADHEALLSTVRTRVLADLQRMPNYTCVQNVTRTYYSPTPAGKLRPYALDRLRLDVAVTPANEIYSWAGAAEFDTRDLTQIIGGGPIGTGAFGAFLRSIFGDDGPRFTDLGETTAGGRPVVEFAYRVARESSRYKIRAADGWVIAAYEGRVVADTATGDLVQLSIRAAGLPVETGASETNIRLDYQRVPVGETTVLLPREARQRFLMRSGIESENVSTFAGCREYRGQSTLRFPDETTSIDNAAGDLRRPPSRLPGHLAVAAVLAAPLDTWTASAGDTVTLHLTRPIRDAARRVVVPAGAAIEARLIRVQRYLATPPRATVIVKPETIERDGARLPFAAVARAREIWQFTGDHVVVPKGYRGAWLTVTP